MGVVGGADRGGDGARESVEEDEEREMIEVTDRERLHFCGTLETCKGGSGGVNEFGEC